MGSICMCHFILLLTIVCTVVVATLGDNTTDSYWLLRIKSELVDPLGALSNWSPTTHICSWNGLTCALNQTHVVGLNLSDSGISGSIQVSSVTSFLFKHLICLQIPS
ncbi:Serine/threonine-protein kinase BRI 2 [Spatholobus suberectus]|nr:Serine/threonine-protein kinase BRI 2 [Spatholobus suberectus]